MNTHRIGTLRLAAATGDSSQAATLHRQLLEAGRHSLMRVLEETFDAVAPAGTIIRIDTLEIPLGRCAIRHLAERLHDKATYQMALREKAASLPRDPGPDDIGREAVFDKTHERHFAHILQYLRLGNLPFGVTMSAREIRAAFLELHCHDAWHAKTLRLIRACPAAACRAAVLRGRPVPLGILERLSPTACPGPLMADNAGIILAAPLFIDMFREAGLTADNIFYDETRRAEAVYLTQRLITDEPPLENELALNKFLCGWPVERPLPLPPPFPPPICGIVEKTLRTLTAHWPPLHGAARADLARLFFKRPGVLYLEEPPLLRIAPEGQDMLLAQLPWSENEIRLPWRTLRAVWHA